MRDGRSKRALGDLGSEFEGAEFAEGRAVVAGKAHRWIGARLKIHS